MSTEQHAKDLRSFLAEVKRRYTEELITVERAADLRFEISALLVKLDRAHKFPVVQLPTCEMSKASPARFLC